MIGKSCEERLQKLNLWSLEERRNRQDLMEVFKICKGLSRIIKYSTEYRTSVGTADDAVIRWLLLAHQCVEWVISLPALLPTRRVPSHLGQYWFSIPPKVEGWVGLDGWSHTKTVYPQTVTHPSTNRDRRRLTSLMCPGSRSDRFTFNGRQDGIGHGRAVN